MKMDMQPRFVTGQGTTNADVYYELADLRTLGIFSGLQLNEPGTMEKLGQQIEATTDLAVQFMDAAEAFITAVVTADAWELREL